MNKQKNTLKRVLALFLALMLVLGVLPMSAFADGGGGGSSGSHITIRPGQGGTGWSLGTTLGYFTRFTLVEFPNGIEGANWKTGKRVGTIDICQHSQNIADTVTLNTNALEYRLMLDGKVGESARLSTLHDHVEKALDADDNAWKPQNQNYVFGEALDSKPVYAFHKLVDVMVSDGKATWNPLLYLFGVGYTGANPKVDNWNDSFNEALLGKLGMFNYNMFQSTPTKTYQVLAEPGMVVQHGDGTKYALTLRDIAAFEAYNAVNAGRTMQQQANVGTSGGTEKSVSWALQNVMMAELGGPLYEDQDDFTDIQGDTLETKSNPVAFKAGRAADVTTGTALNCLGAMCAVTGIGYHGSWNEDEYASYGLGILLPGMNEAAQRKQTLTLTKSLTGAVTDADRTKDWTVTVTYAQPGDHPETADIGLPKAVSVESSTRGAVTPEYLDGDATKGLVVKVKDGETVTITPEMEDGKYLYYHTEEKLSEADSKRIVPHWKEQGKEADLPNTWTNTRSGVNAFNLVNEGAETDKAHLIIDYNYNGASATTGDGTRTYLNDCGTVPYYDGVPEMNVVTGISPKLNGVPLAIGHEETETAICAKCGGMATMKLTYKGLFTEPTGGTQVGDTYTLTHPGLTVLYAQWDKTFDITCNCGTTTGTAEVKNRIYTLYWDYNYYGAAVTTSQAGNFTFYKRMDRCVLTRDDDGNITGHSYPQAEYTEVVVDIPFTYPGVGSEGVPYRNGWEFMGWATKQNAGTGLSGSAATSFKNKGAATGNPADPAYVPKDPGQSTTFYAIWKAKDIVWEANGGIFDMTQAPSGTEGAEWVLSADKTKMTWLGGINHADVVPILKRYPTHTGYTFDQWYFDSNGNVPIAETEMGLIPGRHYYAGWTPQKVKVNYYDTRQGTGIVATQEYDYNEVLSLIANPADTDGQYFTGWQVCNIATNGSIVPQYDAANKPIKLGGGARLDKDTSGIHYHDTSSTPMEDGNGGYWEVNLCAVWNEQVVDYTVNIIWDDVANNDGLRPRALKVGVVSSVGNQLVAEEWVTGETDAYSWSTTIEGLPVTTADASVEKITYSTALLGYQDSNGHIETIRDTGATEGVLLADLTDTKSENAPTYAYALDNISRPDTANTKKWVKAYNGAIYLEHELVRINFPFSIRWYDQFDNDAHRPGKVMLNLYADGVFSRSNPYHADPSVSTVADVGSTGEVWGYRFPNVLKFHNQGELVHYTAEVESLDQVNENVPTGSARYTMKYDAGGDGPDHNGVTFTRTEMDRGSYSGKIVWFDDNNRDGMRPAQVAVHLMGDRWNNRADKFLPTADMDTVIVTGDPTADEWMFGFDNELVYSGGKKIEYSTAIVGINSHLHEGDEQYEWVYAGYNDTHLDLHVSRAHDLRSVEAQVEWADMDNNDGIRPEQIRVRLYADGVALDGPAYLKSVKSNGTNVWTTTFAGVPKFREGTSGQYIVYSIGVEGEPDDDALYGSYISMANGQQERITRYTAAYGKDGELVSDPAAANGPTAVLTHELETCTINLYASWHDDNNKDNKRPSNLLVDLYGVVDGESTLIQTVNLSAGRDKSWTYKCSGLPRYEAGKEIRYHAEVSADFRSQLLADNGYTLSVQDNVVHLYYKTETIGVTASVNWADNDNNDGIRPDKLIAALYVNGKKSAQENRELNRENNWTVTWEDLPAYESNQSGVGQAIPYSVVVETEGMDYAAYYIPEAVTVLDNQTIYITMSHADATQTVETSLFWNDAKDRDGARPKAVDVQLCANGEPVPGTIKQVAGEGDTWAVSFDDVPVVRDGRAIYYSVEMVTDVEPYTYMVTGTQMYLSYEPVTSTLSVSFQFDDRNNADGKRPTGLYLYLTMDGKRVEDSERVVDFDTLLSGNRLIYGKLPVYSASKTPVDYGIEVAFAPDLFGGEGYTAAPSRSIKLNTADIGDGLMNQVVVRLSRAATVGSEKGSIYWFDNDNQRGNRPNKLTVSIHNNATSRVDGPYTLDVATMKVTDKDGNAVGAVTGITEWGDIDDSRWDYEIYGLPQNTVYEDGVAAEIVYWATVNMSGLSNWYSNLDGQSTGMDVTMTHKFYEEDQPQSTQDFDLTIVWADNANAWGYRPDVEGVDVVLLANNKETGYQAHLDHESAPENTPDTWVCHFAKLPTYLNGTAVVWTAAISGKDKYTASQDNHGSYSVITMTQTGSYDLTVRWNDALNNDNKRPETVSVVVLADGKEVTGSPVVLSGDGEVWAGRIENLPVWRDNGVGTGVHYSFRWTENTAAGLNGLYSAKATQNGNFVEGDAFYYVNVEAWEATDDSALRGFNGVWETTLTHDKETLETDFRASVTFDDKANQDGMRPETVYIQLMADGVAQGEPVPVAGDMTSATWAAVWSGLYRYHNGEPVVYTVAPAHTASYPGYTAVTDGSGTQITLTHEPEQVSVTATVNWKDSSELHYVGDSKTETYASIPRVDTYIQLYANGEAVEGATKKLLAADYLMENGKNAGFAKWTWTGLDKKANGEDIVYTFTVTSAELDELLADGYTCTYNNNAACAPTATISHDRYDVRGTVYYLRDTDDSFRLANVPVNAYLYDKAADTYTAVGSARTNAKGEFELLNLPQGLLTIRATYRYANMEYAGSEPVKLDRMDATVRVLVDRDSEPDSDLYRYAASGHAYYQTNKQDPETRKPVPVGSIVLLYQTGAEGVEYVGMATTDANGGYRFENLNRGKYLVNVVFAHEGGTYTIDDADTNGLTFTVTGADAIWPDVVKQVNKTGVVGPETNPDQPETPDVPDTTPEPCVVSGKVYYMDDAQHTTDGVPGVDVYLYTADTNREVAKTETDTSGAWSVEGLAAQNYLAVFSLRGMASRVLAFTVSDADFANGNYEAAPQYFDRATKQPTATIRGVVLAADGSKENALVKVTNGKGEVVDFAYVGQNGEYQFTVPADQTYRTQIVTVGKNEQSIVTGTPGTGLTSLDYYTMSGNFSVDGAAQAGQTISVYKEQTDKTHKLVTATLTDAKGNWLVKIADGGNYKVVSYRGSDVYSERNVTIGVSTAPTVTETAGKYTISGTESFDTLTAVHIDAKGVARAVKELTNGTSYTLTDLAEGRYELTLTRSGKETRYYVECPDNAITRSYRVTISGTVADSSGNPILGATVNVYDNNGVPVGKETVITDGSYAYRELPAGTYTVRVSRPVAGTMLCNRTTAEADSYGNAYADGIDGGKTWTWNINAVPVSGYVSDQMGRPIEGATIVTTASSDPDKAYGSMSGINGAWSLGVAPGTYAIDAIVEADADHIYHATQSVTVEAGAAPITGANLTVNRYTLNGTVAKQGDNTILANADVVISYEDGTLVWEGKTDNEGKFSCLLYPDRYTIRATVDTVENTASVTVKGDADMTVRLDIPVILSGRVTDEDGDAVPDAIIHFEGTKSGTTYTNDQGEYTITLTANELGNYTLWAEGLGVTSDRISVRVMGDTEQNLTLPHSDETATYMLSGVVADTLGNRLENCVVTVTYGDDKEQTMQTSTNLNGKYRFKVANGTYYLTVAYTTEVGCTHTTNAETVVHVNGADVAQNLSLTLSHVVTITVKDNQGKAVAGADVTYMGATSGTVETAANGKVSLDLRGGKYTFSAISGVYESDSVTETVHDTTAIELTVRVPGLANEPPIVEANDTLAISGVVYAGNGEAVSGSDVTLNKFNFQKNGWEPVATAKTDAKGGYRFGSLTEGRYLVITQHTDIQTVTGVPSAYTIGGIAADASGNPYVGARVNLLDASGKTLQSLYTKGNGSYNFANVAGGKTYTVKILTTDGATVLTTENVTPTAATVTIDGTMVDVAGTPVGNAIVSVAGEDGVEWTGNTDATGHYHFELPGGTTYTVSASVTKEQTVDTTNYVRNDADPNSPVLNADGYIIRGLAKDVNGAALNGVSVKLEDAANKELTSQVTDTKGEYRFADVASGKYYVVVSHNGEQKAYAIDTDKTDAAEAPIRPTGEIKISGAVVTDQKVPIRDAEVVVKNMETGDILTLTADKNGKFATGTLPAGRYELIATTIHNHGKSAADRVLVSRSRDDVTLVVVLTYLSDVNKDGAIEVVYTGKDGEFDTDDDYYKTDLHNDGLVESIYAGADKAPGTADDYYYRDNDHAENLDKVFVGNDCVAGTEDDWYMTVGKDGKPAKFFVGKDGIAGTADDVRDPSSNSVGGSSFGGGNNSTAENTVTVTFDSKGGSTVGVQSVEVGKTATEPATPVRYGYRFNGWLDGEKKFDFKTAINSSLTLTADWEYVGVAGTLNTADHMAYIAGMPDGKVYPMNHITRAEVAMIFYRLLNAETREFYKTTKHSFADVSENAWYVTAVATLSNMGILRGKADGKFDPDGVITRAEFAAIAARFDKLEGETMSFPDVPENHWAYREIASAAAKGWVKGYGNGNFGPSDSITRAEAMTLVNRVLGRDTITVESITTEGEMIIWPDNLALNAWYYLAVQEATNGHAFRMDGETETWANLRTTEVGNQ